MRYDNIYETSLPMMSSKIIIIIMIMIIIIIIIIIIINVIRSIDRRKSLSMILNVIMRVIEVKR